MFRNAALVSKFAMAVGVALAVTGIIMITDTQSGETTTVGIEHVSLGGLTAALLFLVPVTMHLGRLTGKVRAATIGSAGQLTLAALTLTSNIRGEDLSIFPAVAIPANLAIFGGFVALAIAMRRELHVPLPLAIGLPASWIFALPLSAVGGTVVAAGYFMVLGYLLAYGGLQQVSGRAAPSFARA